MIMQLSQSSDILHAAMQTLLSRIDVMMTAEMTIDDMRLIDILAHFTGLTDYLRILYGLSHDIRAKQLLKLISMMIGKYHAEIQPQTYLSTTFNAAIQQWR